MLKKFKGIHKGKRGFLIACGPSLSKTDISKLDNEITFVVSRGYKREKLNITYLFIGDMYIYQQFYDEISEVNCDALFVSKGIYFSGLPVNKNTYYFTGHGEKKFHTDITKSLYGGGTSTFLAMQFAYYMGIQELYAIGLDHSWNFSNSVKIGHGSGGDIMRNINQDNNHFSKDFYGKSVTWFYPKMDKMAEAYKMASEAYTKDNRILSNASLETKLPNDIISRTDYNTIYKV